MRVPLWRACVKTAGLDTEVGLGPGGTGPIKLEEPLKGGEPSAHVGDHGVPNGKPDRAVSQVDGVDAGQPVMGGCTINSGFLAVEHGEPVPSCVNLGWGRIPAYGGPAVGFMLLLERSAAGRECRSPGP